ncbi:MAG: viroplasmin family protein [Candidatus Pacebacteria bacterium]|nr:viroplasmin family protein [Candidatus Paceibacterota bacterium]
MKILTIYTDGASRGNPGPGGWGAVLMTDSKVIELAGAQNPATNNQMELEAVIKGLDYAVSHFAGYTVELHADSTYVLKGIESWLDGWVRNGWITTTKKPVENKSQWQKLLRLRDELGRHLKLNKVEGHSGHIYNDRCDELAVKSALSEKIKSFKGSLKDYKTYLEENPPKSEVKKSSSKSKNSGPAYSYVSLVGGKVYADKTWAQCEKRVNGTKGAKYKKVFSKAEETGLVQDYTLSTLL